VALHKGLTTGTVVIEGHVVGVLSHNDLLLAMRGWGQLVQLRQDPGEIANFQRVAATLLPALSECHAALLRSYVTTTFATVNIVQGNALRVIGSLVFVAPMMEWMAA
jgi:hypothetical protein